jgi:hypothetical protein
MRMLASALTALLVALVLAWPSIIFGADVHLFTPAVAVQAGEAIICSALNVSNQTLHLKYEIRDQNGSLIGDQDFPSVSPGSAPILFVGNIGAGFIMRYCKFIMVTGGKTDVRAGATITPGAVVIPAQ